jgi:hypothetical protein
MSLGEKERKKREKRKQRRENIERDDGEEEEGAIKRKKGNRVRKHKTKNKQMKQK